MTVYLEFRLTPDKRYHLSVKNWEATKQMLHMQFAPGKWEFNLNLEAQVKISTGNKTNKQLAYYFGVVVPTICSSLIDVGYKGITVEATDNYLREMFLLEHIPNLTTGEYITAYKTISLLDKDEMRIYIDECINFAAETFKILIPQPNE